MSLSGTLHSKRKLSCERFTSSWMSDICLRWYTLLNYLYTDKVHFLPLSSAAPGGPHESLTSSQDEPKCSAKSMYRLASRVRIASLPIHSQSALLNDTL